MTTLRDKKVKIRKPHRCWGCAKSFESGSEMYNVVQVYDQEISSTYWCMSCLKIWNDLRYDDDREGWRLGELAQYVNEN